MSADKLSLLAEVCRSDAEADVAVGTRRSGNGRFWEWLCENAHSDRRTARIGRGFRHARMAAVSGPAPMIAIMRFRL